MNKTIALTTAALLSACTFAALAADAPAKPASAAVETLSNGVVIKTVVAGTGAKPKATDVVLTPAACYHIYPHFAGGRLEGRRVVTTRNTCFRCEANY